MKKVQSLSNPVTAYAALAIAYILLILLLPANKKLLAAFDITALQYHLLLLLVAIPYIIVWYFALNGYGRLQKYATIIKDTPEGQCFQQLSKGVGWLAYGLPIAAIVAILVNSIANQFSSLNATAVIINNYLSLVIPLIGFIFIARAAKGLAHKENIKVSASDSRLLVLFFMLLGVLYCYFTFKHFDQNSVNSNNPYFLPIWLILTTLIIPFLYSWFIGLLAAYEFVVYSLKSEGLLYKQALQLLGIGLAIVIVRFIALQYINTVLPRDGSVGVNSILIIVYLLRFVMGAGFIAIAMGANKLRRIEEV